MAKRIIGDEKETEYGFDPNEFEKNAMIAYRAREKLRRLGGTQPSAEDIKRMHRKRPTFRKRVEK